MTEHYQGIASGRFSAPQSHDALAASSRSPIASQVLASLLDSLPGSTPESSAQNLIREGWSFSQAWQRLPEERRAAIREHLPANTLAELLSLSQENDGELFFESLLHLGQRQRQENPTLALACFELLQQSLNEDFPGRPSGHLSLIARAQRESDAIEGRGDIGARVEYLSGNFIRETTSPIGLASMAAGGMAFSAVRTGMLARLLSGPAGTLTRGFGARAVSSLVGFGAELPAFVFSSRALHEAGGHAQDWSLRAVGRDLATAGITLGLLKLGGAGAGAASQRWAQGTGLFPQATRMFLPQAAMFTGIIAAHRIEESLELRPHVDGATLFTDAFSTFLQFHVSGRLMEAAMGRGYAAWQHELNIRGEAMASTPRPSGSTWLDGLRLTPNLAPAGMAGHIRGERLDPLRDNILMMSNNGEGKPPSPPPNGPSKSPMASVGSSGGRRITQPSPPAMSSLARMVAQERGQPPMIVEGTRLGGGTEGRYQVMKPLGEGGTGAVFLVRDTREVAGTHSDRWAVIKVPKRKTDSNMLSRIVREIRITESLASSPWAAPVYDHFEYPAGSGIFVPVMAYVDGHSFAAHLAASFRGNGPLALSLDKRIDLFAELCLGIQDAHNRGISHNDLKPDNAKVDSHGRLRILDWGIARRFSEMANGTAEAPSPSSDPFDSHILSGLDGTPGYMPPELMLRAMSNTPLPSNPRVRDIYALGIFLYEAATGLHPLGNFRPGDRDKGEPELVPVWDAQYPQLHSINQNVALQVVSEEGLQPPPFRKILTGEFPGYLTEIEQIALRAMSVNPEERFQTASELREAVLMARARSERDGLNLMARERQRMETEMASGWDWRIFNVVSKANPLLWAESERTMHRLNGMRSAWREGVNALIMRLHEMTRFERIDEAHRMIAELSWAKLEEGGDRLAPEEARILEQRIRENDFELTSGRRFSEALNGSAHIELNFRSSDPEMQADPRVRVIPWIREVDNNGRETGNFRPSAPLIEGRYSTLRDRLRPAPSSALPVNGQGLPSGYYSFEIHEPGFAPISVPVHVSRRAVLDTVQWRRIQNVDVDLVPREQVPIHMVPVQGGLAHTGWDFYHDGMPSNVYSFPMRTHELPTFAIARDVITVAEYRAYIEDLLRRGQIADALEHMPRKGAVVLRGTLDPGEVTRIFRDEKKNYYWRIDPVFSNENGFGWRLNDPISRLDVNGVPIEGTHLDPNGDPILADQPISAISPKAAHAYVKWRSERDGFNYRLATADEIEKVNRNSFPWVYPWGYESSPFSAILRMTFQGDRSLTTFPQPIGQHPMGQEYYRDFTIYGTRENLGNVREFTGSEGEAGTVVLSGGSVRVPYGPFLIAASRNYAHLMNQVADSIGGIRLAMDIPPALPRSP